MKTKEFNVQYKDEGSGSVEGYASTWIRQRDSYGDVVAEGAFTKTLKERWNGGKGIPFLWAHQMDNLKSIIGTAEADEDEGNVPAYELQELDLFEISAVMVPANDDAGVVDVKSGRRNSKADEDKIKQAIKLLQDVLGEIDQEDDGNGEDDPEGNAGAEDRKESNPEKKDLLDYINKI